MTVTYLQHVQTSKIGGFLRLLLIWKGSVLKGIWPNLAVFLALWYFILIVYRFALVKNEDIKQTFERMCVFFDAHDTSIPLGFILGFYVSQIGECALRIWNFYPSFNSNPRQVQRWWAMYNAIPWPDKLGLNLVSYLPGGGEARRVRRYIARLVNLSAVLCLQKISTGVARRFPSYDHMVEAGLMTQKEKVKMEKMDVAVENIHQTTWYPIQWAQVDYLHNSNGWFFVVYRQR